MTKIKEARVAKGMTLKDVAIQAQISIATVSRVERGQIGMRPASAKRLAKVLDLDPVDLIFIDRADGAA